MRSGALPFSFSLTRPSAALANIDSAQGSLTHHRRLQYQGGAERRSDGHADRCRVSAGSGLYFHLLRNVFQKPDYLAGYKR